ncbi:hypothetical protein EON62_02090, partial [archaeon]
MSSQAMHRAIEVYLPDLDVWVRGKATAFIPELQRIAVEFEDGTKRLLSADKHAYRFVDDGDAGGAAEPAAGGEGVGGEEEDNAAADDGLQTLAQWNGNIDLDALQEEQAEQEEWLRMFDSSTGGQNASFSSAPWLTHRSDGEGSAHAGDSSLVAAATGGHETSAYRTRPSLDIPLSGDYSFEEAGTVRTTDLPPLGGARTGADDAGAAPSLEPSIQHADARGASTLSSMQPPSSQVQNEYDDYKDGFVRSDLAAERLGAHVWQQTLSSGGRANVGLLACCILRGRNLASMLPSTDHRVLHAATHSSNVSVRVCLLYPAPGALHVDDAPFPRLHVSGRVDPYSAQRIPLFRTASTAATHGDSLWGVSAPAFDAGRSVAGQHGFMEVAPSPTNAGAGSGAEGGPVSSTGEDGMLHTSG